MPIYNLRVVSGKAPEGSLLSFYLIASFSFPAKSLQEFATVLRNLEDERIRMVSTAGLLLIPDSVIILKKHGICCQKNRLSHLSASGS